MVSRRGLPNGRIRTLRPLLISSAFCALLAACTAPGAGGGRQQAVPNLSPDSRGVITYATYQVAVARDGDTLDTIASRVGTTSAELAMLGYRHSACGWHLLLAMELIRSVPRSGSECLSPPPRSPCNTQPVTSRCRRRSPSAVQSFVFSTSFGRPAMHWQSPLPWRIDLAATWPWLSNRCDPVRGEYRRAVASVVPATYEFSARHCCAWRAANRKDSNRSVTRRAQCPG